MRVLHIDTGAEMRGGQHQVMLLMKTLMDEGHHALLAARPGSPLFNAAMAGGIETYPATAKIVWRHSRRVDLVHAHDARAHTLAAVASRRQFVVSRRVAFPVRNSVFSRWKYGRAARYLAVSHFVERELLAAGIAQETIEVVYDAVDTIKADYPWSPENPAVSLAMTDRQKGRNLVEEAARVSGVEVLFTDDLQAGFQRASMFVYISRSEGLGSAALLAMNYGVPVIASRTEGLTEIVVDGFSGILVENEVGSIVRAMREVLGKKAFAQGLIAEGHRTIAERFTREHLLRSTIAAYEKVMAV